MYNNQYEIKLQREIAKIEKSYYLMFVKDEKCKCFKLLLSVTDGLNILCETYKSRMNTFLGWSYIDPNKGNVETTLQLAINLFHENNIFVCFSSNNE